MTLRVPPGQVRMPASIRREKAAPSRTPYSVRSRTDAATAGGTSTMPGRVVTGRPKGHSPRETFCGRTLEEALAWCLVWLMAPEIGVGMFRH